MRFAAVWAWVGPRRKDTPSGPQSVQRWNPSPIQPLLAQTMDLFVLPSQGCVAMTTQDRV